MAATYTLTPSTATMTYIVRVPTITFGATTVAPPAIGVLWRVWEPAVLQPNAQTVVVADVPAVTWTVWAPTVVGQQYVPPFVGEVTCGGVEVGDVQEAPGP